jgi:hypothetical protein
MGTCLATIPHPPLPEVLPPAGAAPRYDRMLRQAARELKANLMTIAFYGARLRAEEAYLALGFESEDQYRASLDIPRSTWFKYVRIGEALYDLPWPDLMAISTGNAELLIQVDPILRDSYPWVEEAQRLTSAEFAAKVTERNRQSGGGKEACTYYRVKVPYSVKSFLEAAVEAYRQANELSSPAQALEFLVADRHDRLSTLGRITEIRRLLRTTIYLFEQRQLKEITEEMYLLKKARRLIDAAREDQVSASGAAPGGQAGPGRP